MHGKASGNCFQNLLKGKKMIQDDSSEVPVHIKCNQTSFFLHKKDFSRGEGWLGSRGGVKDRFPQCHPYRSSPGHSGPKAKDSLPENCRNLSGN